MKKHLGALSFAALSLWAASIPATAQTPGISDGAIRVGVIEDMSGVFASITGPGSVAAARLAIEDAGGKVLGKPVEFVFADHQNKPDIAAAIARKWFDEDKVDAILDVASSSTALAVIEIAKSKNKIITLSAPGSMRIANESCGPTVVHWTYDTYAIAHGSGKSLVKQGLDTWFFLTADYAFGHSLEKDTSDFVLASGGKVLGSVRHPVSTSDFASALLQAQTSKAKVVALANAGGDTVNAIKQASQFGLSAGGQRLAAMAGQINDVHGLGLQQAQGLVVTEAVYWDMNDETRKLSARFYDQVKAMPNMLQAGVYSAMLHYLKAVQAAGTDDTDAVMKKMREMPINDAFFKNGKIREDGRMVHDIYVFEVKKPSESKKPWDYYKLLTTIPAADAFQPLSASRCPLVKK